MHFNPLVARSGIALALLTMGLAARSQTPYRFTRIANTSTFTTLSLSPSINNQGNVAFLGIQSGRRGIHTGSGGATTTLVEDSSFSIDNPVAFNDNNVVAYGTPNGVFARSASGSTTIATSANFSDPRSGAEKQVQAIALSVK